MAEPIRKSKLLHQIQTGWAEFWHSILSKESKGPLPNVRKQTLKLLALRRSALMIVAIGVTLLVSLLYLTASQVMVEGYANLERQATQKSVERVVQTYNKNLQELQFFNLSWSGWDETYEFVQRPTQKYIENNYSDDVLLHNKVSISVILNATGQIIHGLSYGDQRRPRDLPQSVADYIAKNPELWRHTTVRNCHQGLGLLPEAPLYFTACPIATSQYKGPIRGTVLMGHYLDQAFVDHLSQITRSSLKFHRIDQRDRFSTSLNGILEQLIASPQSILIQPESEARISGYALLLDQSGKPTVLVQVDELREIHHQGKISANSLLLSIIAIGLLLGLTTLWLIEMAIQFWQQQQNSQLRYQTLIAQASEGICLVDAQTQQFLETNRALQELLGYSAAELLTMRIEEVFALPMLLAEDIQLARQQPIKIVSDRQLRHHHGRLIEAEISINLITSETHPSKWRMVRGRRKQQQSQQQRQSEPTQDVLCIVIRDMTERKQTEAALRASEQRLSWQSTHDDLTGLSNRREFERRLNQALNDAQTYHQKHSLCYLDLDQFKIVNDTCGHIVGDELLRQVTDLLRTRVRATDVLARIGGDEFGLLLNHCPMEQAFHITNIMRQSLQDFRFIWQGKVFNIGVSIGLIEINSASRDLPTILSAADAACHVAKNRGRNRIHIYQPDDRELLTQHSEMQWVTELTKALEEDRFCLHYQTIRPIANSSSQGEHYEVLLRLRDETNCLITPDCFMPAAERYNLMNHIDRWVIHTLFQQQAQHYRQSGERCQTENYECLFAINLSGASINDEQFIEFLYEQFEQHQIPPQVICFEITETLAIANLSKATQFIQAFRQLGCRFALDDFGSGMSSFAYLKSLPVDYLKIDGSFVKDILTDSTRLGIVEAINRVGHVMGLQTIAEFVENDEILTKLKAIGVDYAQGYGIAQPTPFVSLHIEALQTEALQTEALQTEALQTEDDSQTIHDQGADNVIRFEMRLEKNN